MVSYVSRLISFLLFLFPGEDASLHSGGSLSPSSDIVANELQGLSLEEQEQQKAEWSAQLAKVSLGDPEKFRRRKIKRRLIPGRRRDTDSETRSRQQDQGLSGSEEEAGH